MFLEYGASVSMSYERGREKEDAAALRDLCERSLLNAFCNDGMNVQRVAAK